MKNVLVLIELVVPDAMSLDQVEQELKKTICFGRPVIEYKRIIPAPYVTKLPLLASSS